MANITTWAEVADTTVKIGLSALIGAIAAYLIAKRNRRHDFDKEYFRRRQGVIEEVSTSFASIHALFFDVCIDYSNLVDVFTAGLPPTKEQVDRYGEYLRKIGAALREMHVLEGKLLVVGAIDATSSLRAYRLYSVEVNDMIQLQKPSHTKQQVGAILEKLHDNRDHFYRTLAKTFKELDS